MFNIGDISKYRSELMGFAILWIMTFHFSFTQIQLFDLFAKNGYGGVEIFMLVSGYGIYCSLEKENSLYQFYKKRFLRIFPIYYIIGITDSIIIFHDNFVSYLFRYTTIGFWTNGCYADWYIPTVIILYLIAPFLKCLFDLRKTYICFIGALLFILLSFFLADGIFIDRAHYFMVYRVPAFIFGMFCADWVKHGIDSRYYYAAAIVGLPLFFYLYSRYQIVYNYRFLSFLFLMPTIVLSAILLRHYANIQFINHTLSKMGKASLEIYLVQGFVYHLIIYKIFDFTESYHDIQTIGCIIISSLLGYYIHCIWEKNIFNLIKSSYPPT